MRRGADRATGIIQEDPRLVISDDRFKVGRPVVRRRRQKGTPMGDSFAPLVDR
jgi:hypothetical protein